MISKTLEQWIAETEKYTSIYYERYAQAWSDPRCSEMTRNYYCDVAKQYWNLRELLQHLKTYGRLQDLVMDATKCSACKSNPNHVENLNKTYDKYKKWIEYVTPR